MLSPNSLSFWVKQHIVDASKMYRTKLASQADWPEMKGFPSVLKPEKSWTNRDKVVTLRKTVSTDLVLRCHSTMAIVNVSLRFLVIQFLDFI